MVPMEGEGLRIGDVLRASMKPHFTGPGEAPYSMSYTDKVLFDLAQCGSGHLGWFEFGCDHCSEVEWRGRSCGSRYCSSCGQHKTAKWVEARESELLETSYFHCVFTTPGRLRSLVEENKKLLLDLLFDCARDTLKEFAADPKYLGAVPSMLSVLHTWNQRLDFHPHVHCVVSGGGLNLETGRWVEASNPRFLFPTDAMRVKFRGKYLAGLRKLYEKGDLCFRYPSNQELEDPLVWQEFIDKLYRTSWVVYAKAPFAGPEQVVRYFARYVNRTAISNSRLERLDGDQVTFRYKDRKKKRVLHCTVHVDHFAWMFSRHILPKGYRRIRYWGLLSANTKRHLPEAQRQSRVGKPIPLKAHRKRALLEPERKRESETCSACEKGKLVLLAHLIPVRRSFSLHEQPIPPPLEGDDGPDFRRIPCGPVLSRAA